VNGQTTTISNAPNSPINSPNVSLFPKPIPVPEVQTLTTNPQGNVVIGTQTASLNTDGNLIIGTQTFTPNANGEFVVTGVQTITESGGQVVTISGETLSVETTTVGSTKAIGAIIASFIGAATPTTNPSASSMGAPAQYTGAAVRFEGLSEGSLLVIGVLVLVVWL
jgi:hypothetical protein